MLDVVVDGLKDKKKILLPGLGSLKYKVRAAYNYTNQHTGAVIARPAAGYVGWKTASTLKVGLICSFCAARDGPVKTAPCSPADAVGTEDGPEPRSKDTESPNGI